MLCELKYQFDILDSGRDLSPYSLVILPDYIKLEGALLENIKKHIKKGGAVISSAWAGLNESGEDFALGEWGLSFKGESAHDPAYITVSPDFCHEFPDMPVTLYDKGTTVAVKKGAKVLGEITAPFYNKHWDGEHAFMYMPPDKKTGEPALVRSGNIIHFTHPLFSGYCRHAQLPMRSLLDSAIKASLTTPVVKTTNLQSFSRVTVTQQPGRLIVHILAYVPEKRGEQIEMIEEPIEVRDAVISVRDIDMKLKRVSRAPEGTRFEIFRSGDYASVKIPLINGYAAIVFEE